MEILQQILIRLKVEDRSHLICGLLGVKFARPVSFEVDGIDKDKSGQGVQHVWLDQIFNLGLSDLFNPVVDQPGRSFSVTVVCFLKDICC